MSHKNFIKVDNDLYNLRYVKKINCDDNECRITIANTDSASGYSSLSDREYRFGKDTRQYIQLRSYYDSISIYHK